MAMQIRILQKLLNSETVDDFVFIGYAEGDLKVYWHIAEDENAIVFEHYARQIADNLNQLKVRYED
ncbi:MAG: hypothetical protein ACYCVB_17195 [Bacilli bacterium]